MMKPCQSNKNQSTHKRGNTRNKMEGPMSKKTNEPPKMADHKGTSSSQSGNPLLLQEAYQIRKGEDLFRGHLA
jgi:hypothetical protein